jgi:hypothetical protein
MGQADPNREAAPGYLDAQRAEVQGIFDSIRIEPAN